jgi:hypothetical protein
MAWIRTVPPQEAQGALRLSYDAALSAPDACRSCAMSLAAIARRLDGVYLALMHRAAPRGTSASCWQS